MSNHVYQNKHTGEVVVFDGPHDRLAGSDRWSRLTGKDAETHKGDDVEVKPSPRNRVKKDEG